MPAVFVVASAFLLWQVAGRQVWRRLPCGCRERAAVSRCGSCVPLYGHTLVERFEGMVLDEGYPVNLDVVDLGSKLHASDDRTDVGAVNADNAVLNLLFLSQRALLAEHFLERSQAF